MVSKGMVLRRLGLMLFLIFAMIYPSLAKSEDAFEIFDGRVYNGKFYPRIDIIEWNEENMASHMEFQDYSPDMPIEMSFKLDDANGKKVMLVNYYFPERNEHLCRRVIAPGHFKKDFFIYKDMSDPERDITIVSPHKLPDRKGRSLVESKPYVPCDEVKSDRLPAGKKPENKPIGEPTTEKKVPGSEGAIQSDDGSIPFSGL